MRWVLKNQETHNWVKECSKALDLSSEVAKLVSQLPFSNEEELRAFLFPSLKNVEDPGEIENLTQAVELIDRACKAKKNIAIVSDYDVDGITSMVLMKRCFDVLDFKFHPFFPDREKEGYGLTERLVERILSCGITFDYLIALDCGTNSVAPVQKLKEVGVQAIIVDHHQHSCQELPEAIIVNPHVHPQVHSKSAQELCSVGLAFKWVHAWLRYLKKENYAPALKIKLRNFLDLVALGTVADLVPLQNENRLWVCFGLKEIIKSQIVGLRKLVEISGCNMNFPLCVEDVSFKLAPRINVSGRLVSAEIPYKLLTSSSEDLCQDLAEHLNELNCERQRIERKISEEAESMILANPNRWAYVLYKEDWHIGVVGIVAGRLSRKFNCPVFVLGAHEGQAKGSGRSIPEVNLVKMFSKAESLILRWGGHPAAVGLTVDIEKLPLLDQFFNDYLKELFPLALPEPTLNIASIIQLKDLNEKFLNEIDRMSPFGQGNETPLFVIKNVVVNEGFERFGQQGVHIRFKLNGFSVVGWGMGTSNFPLNQSVDLAVCCGWNYWQTTRFMQLQLIDWHLFEG